MAVVNTALDTNICIALIQNSSKAVRRRLAFADRGTVVMSAIVLFELVNGALRSGRPEPNLQALRNLRSLVPAMDFDDNDAAEAARVRRELESSGTSIGPYEVLIAGHARARGLVLATNNVREFGRVQGLVVEDWLADL